MTALLSAGNIVNFSRGNLITSREDEAPSFMIILSGRVRVYSNTIEGRAFLVTFLDPGEIYGARPCLDRSGRSYDSVAETNVSILLIKAGRFNELLRSNSELMDLTVQLLCHRLDLLSQVAEQFAIWTPSQQLAWRILYLLNTRSWLRPESREIRLNISQDDLASMIGKTRQTTNKLLKDLQNEGFISVDYGTLLVHDMRGLSAYVDQGV